VVARANGFDVMVYRFEDGMSVIAEALAALLDGPVPVIISENLSHAKPYHAAYEALRAAPGFPHELVNEELGSCLACHFYTPDERSEFARRWLASEISSRVA
jgi:hypothetical protein